MKYLVRLEQVAFTEVEVDANSALLARHAVMSRLEDDDAAKLLATIDWQDGGLNVESAREVAINEAHG